MNSFLYIKFKPNNLPRNRFKIIVSLKVSKKAVIRNRIKRRIREILRQSDIKQGYDMVVITNKEIVEKSFQELQEVITKQISKLLTIN